MRLKEITICGFRGFNKKQTISLDNNVEIGNGARRINFTILIVKARLKNRKTCVDNRRITSYAPL